MLDPDIVTELDNWIAAGSEGREIAVRAREVVLMLRGEVAMLCEHLVRERKANRNVEDVGAG